MTRLFCCRCHAVTPRQRGILPAPAAPVPPASQFPTPQRTPPATPLERSLGDATGPSHGPAQLEDITAVQQSKSHGPRNQDPFDSWPINVRKLGRRRHRRGQVGVRTNQTCQSRPARDPTSWLDRPGQRTEKDRVEGAEFEDHQEFGGGEVAEYENTPFAADDQCCEKCVEAVLGGYY